jgi:hypothetical protein
MKGNQNMSTPRGRRKDRAPLKEIDTRATVPTATGDPNPVESRDPTYEEIARRAYQLFEQRGREHGHDWDDWFQAERELRVVAPRGVVETSVGRDLPYAAA